MSLEDFGEPALAAEDSRPSATSRASSEGKGLGLVVDAFIRLKQARALSRGEAALRRRDDGGGRALRGDAEEAARRSGLRAATWSFSRM